MFVRFRPICRRLAVILVANHREGPKVRQIHIARLGSVALPEPISADERRQFWAQLPGRFAAIAADRVTPDDKRKVIAGIEARIPKPADAEERQAEIRAAVAKARLMSKRRGKRAAGDAPPIAASVGREPSRAAS